MEIVFGKEIMFKYRTFFILLCSLILLNCSHKSTVHGHYLKEADVEKLQIDASTKSDVRQVLGTPSAVDPFGDQNWFYIGQTNRKKVFKKPEILDRQIFVFSFNEKDILTEITELDLDQSNQFEIASKKTRTAGKEPSFVQQFIGNFGRFRNKLNQREAEKKR